MLKLASSVLLLAALAGQTTARSVPQGVRSFYDSVVKAGTCKNKPASGFYALSGGSSSFSYCGDHRTDLGIVYLQGSGGQLADMDVDCDGAQGGPADDGRCKGSGDTQSITAFQDTIQAYNAGIKDVNANVHPYIVFGNSGSKAGYKTFDPQQYGIEPLSVMAVVCGSNLFYGVWADINGDETVPLIGEASISLATACFGKNNISGNNGHTETDVLYIGFAGKDAVPGKSGAK